MKKQRFHFIGICGISMSALAFYLKEQGHFVQGSDISNEEIKQKLKEYNINVFDCHKKENIKDIDIVVYNFAISEQNEELKEAQKQNLTIISRAELLSKISAEYNNVISVAGSHGKTSTTKMIYNVLKDANLNPTLHIGGITSDGDFGMIIGEKKFFITEACEFHDSFLLLKSKVGIVLNIEPEHLDYFKTFSNEQKSYQLFMQHSEYVVNLTSEHFLYEARNIKEIRGKYCYDCYYNDKFCFHINLGCFGKYNIKNSLAVIDACKKLGISDINIINGLEQQLNIKRRFEIVKPTYPYIIHDYAHHPTEIKKTLNTFLSYIGNQKNIVIFQPHTFSRTKTLFNEFLTCFDDVQNLLFVKTYPAREKYDKNYSSYSLYKKLKTIKNAKYLSSFDLVKKYIQKMQQQGYNIIVFGAGDIYKVCEQK